MLAVCVISPLLIGGCASTAGNGSSVSLSKAWNGTLDYILGSDDSSESGNENWQSERHRRPMAVFLAKH